MKISLLASTVAAVYDRQTVFSTQFRSLLTCLFVGWAALSVFAQGNDNPTGAAGVFNGNSTTGCSVELYTANAMRVIPDLTVCNAVGTYPLQWARIMNSRSNPLGFFGQGGGWRHSYQWSCTGASGSSNPPSQVTVYYPDGRAVIFTHTTGTSYSSPVGVNDRFQGVVGFGYCYFLLADGGQVFYQRAYSDGQGGWNFSYDPADKIIDPNGLVTTLTNSSGRLIAVREPAGRRLNIYYNTDGFIRDVDVLASDGHVSQWVTYTYTLFSGTAYNVLTEADYIYSAGETPPKAFYSYQTSNTSTSGYPLISTCQDVRYPGPMKNIAYTFVRTNPLSYGELSQEKNANGTVVTTLTVNTVNNTRTETRGDGPTRTFTYGAYLGTTGIYKAYLLKSYTDFINKSPKNTWTLSYDAYGHINSIQDANLHTTSFTRLAATGAITKITHPGDASHIDYAYEDPTTGYYLKSVTDELGHITTYLHDNTATMNTSEIDYPDGGVEKFTYNGYNQVLSHTMPANTSTGTTGGTETYAYDTGGKELLVKYTPPASLPDLPTQYAYDVTDHLQTITDGRGNVTTLYHNEIGQLTIVQHPDTDKSLVGYSYNADGTLAIVNEQLNATDWAETTYTYDDYKRLKTMVRPMRDASDTGARTTYFWYDANGTTNDYTHTNSNPTHITTPAGVDTVNVFDANHRLLTTTLGDTTYPDSTPGTTSYTYDAVGNLKTMKDPNGQTSGAIWTYNYDERDRLINLLDPLAADRNSLGHTVDYTYDGASNKKSERRANDQLITYDTYDNLNRLTQMTVPQGATPIAVTHYTWTKAGKLDTMTDPGVGSAGRVYNHDYDLLNRLVTTTYPTGGGTETRTYDAAGNLATFKNRAGNTQTFTYDTRNRETRYDWDDLGVTQARTLSYDDASRILTCNVGNQYVTRTYFADGLLATEHVHNYNYADYDGTVSYTYDADGRKATTVYPSGRTFTSGYTPRGELRTRYDITNGWTSTYQAWYIYDPSGNLTNRYLNLAQTHTSYTGYDALNRLGQAQHFLVGSSPKFNYAYDMMSRRLYEERDGTATTTDGFGYDLNSELNSFRRDGTLSGSTVTGGTLSSLVYDASGNRTSLVEGSVTTTYATANNLNQYPTVGGLGATYDGNGNLKTYDGWTYTYDAMNRLTAAVKGTATANFWYDGFNRICTWQQNGSGFARFNVYDGWDLVAEYQSGNVLDTEYLHGAGSDELVSMTRLGQTYYFFQDGRGNTSHLADSTGALVETTRYDAYGEPTTTVATGKTATGNRFLFSGREYFPVVGLYNYRNRFYSKDWGRFLQPDPIGFSGDPANLYRYCANNPVNASDPSGTGPTFKRSSEGIDGEPTNASAWGNPHAGGLPDWIFGYDGNAGSGVNIFNLGRVGGLGNSSFSFGFIGSSIEDSGSTGAGSGSSNSDAPEVEPLVVRGTPVGDDYSSTLHLFTLFSGIPSFGGYYAGPWRPNSAPQSPTPPARGPTTTPTIAPGALGTVTQVINDVRLLPANAPAIPAIVGMSVFRGQALETGYNSRAEFTFFNGYLFRLGSYEIYNPALDRLGPAYTPTPLPRFGDPPHP